jgi:phospholipid transport system transporter-binding protein
MQVSGAVTIETANVLFEDGLKSLPDSNLVIDLAQLEKVDSAAVSLMLVWLREAQRNNVKLRFVNVPDNLSSLAKLYGVAELLAPNISE